MFLELLFMIIVLVSFALLFVLLCGVVTCVLLSLLAAVDGDSASIAPTVYPATFAVMGLIGFVSWVLSVENTTLLRLLLIYGCPAMVWIGWIIGRRAGVRRNERSQIRLAGGAQAKSLNP